MHSHSNSFGNDAEKDTAGCRASYRKSIVIGGEIMAQAIATAASVVAAVCNIALMVLLYQWYGPKSGKR